MDTKSVILECLRSERRLTRETVSAMAGGDIAFRPTPEQMTFGNQALHILSSYATLMKALQGEGWNWDQGMTTDRYASLEAILDLYAQESERVFAFVADLAPSAMLEEIQTGWGAKETLLQLLVNWLAHEAHHRGQMVTYLRLAGKQPAAY